MQWQSRQNQDKKIAWWCACLGMTMMRQWVCKFSNEQKACLLIEGHCRMWKTLQRFDLAYMAVALSIPPPSYGRLSRREMTLLCSPLCLLFYAHTRGTTHVSWCPQPTHPFRTVKNIPAWKVGLAGDEPKSNYIVDIQAGSGVVFVHSLCNSKYLRLYSALHKRCLTEYLVAATVWG